MKALRRAIVKRPWAWRGGYRLGIAVAAAAALLVLYGLWLAAAAAVLGAAVLLWLTGGLRWPLGEGAHWRRVALVINDSSAAVRQAHALDPGPRRAALVLAAAEREARRLRKMRPPASMAADHAELVALAERQVEAVKRADRAELEELRKQISGQVESWREQVLPKWSGEA